MSLRRRLLIAFALSVLIGFSGFLWWAKGVLRNSYAQVVEDVMVDIASLTASQIEADLQSGKPLTPEILEGVISAYKQRPLNAKIFDHEKTESGLEFYVTDENGRIIFSSRKQESVGDDYSGMNDVSKTLKGQYGARATRLNPQDPRTSVYYVGAPIKVGGKIVGVVSVIKARDTIDALLSKSLDTVILGMVSAVVAIGLFGSLLVLWITKPVDQLKQYAFDVSSGKKASLPKIKHRELKQLGEAFETMRISLEGKKTIERNTQALTHELKSPLTAIRGAAELCLEPEMPFEDRKRFLENIINESRRMSLILEKLLLIASLEAKTQLENAKPVSLATALEAAKQGLMGMWEQKSIEITIEADPTFEVEGDEFLITQALRNLIQNAIEFSPAGSKIEIIARENQITVTDHGSGIPDFAKERLFEKFFSTERPDTKRKGTGLGLNFVRETLHLHGAKIEIASPPPGLRNGTQAKVSFS